MIYPNLPKNEIERQQELLKYEILDSEREVEYDEITALAAEICGSEISLMSLLDNDRQWFKSNFGLEIFEASRELAFCSHTINQKNLNDLFIVENAGDDQRFHDHPYVIEAPNLRFYAGACLLSKNGYPLGTLCVIDSKPINLNENQKKSLKTLAKCAQNLLELRRKDLYNQKLLNEIQEKNSDLKQFVQIASHDLLHPVNNISSLLDYIEKNEHNMTDNSLQSLVYAKNSANRMGEVIRSVSEYNRTGTNENFENISINKILNEVQSDISEYIRSKRAIITQNIEHDSVYGNPVEFRILLQNLIINGIKFQPEGNIPNISISTITKKPNYLSIEISDNGIGVDCKYFDRIFNLFERLNASETFAGTGTGLAICKKIVLNHGGNITVNSELNVGTTFTIHLPKQN